MNKSETRKSEGEEGEKKYPFLFFKKIHLAFLLFKGLSQKFTPKFVLNRSDFPRPVMDCLRNFFLFNKRELFGF